MPVYLAQLKCPNNHCVIAILGVYADDASAQQLERTLREAFDEAAAGHLLNPWCGLCNSRNLHIDLRATQFETLEEAEPYYKELERRQLATAEFIKQSKS